MQKIFIIEKIKFVYSVLEKTFAQNGIDTYIHDLEGDFSYFVDDLRPDLLLVSLDMIEGDIEAFKKELSKSQHDVRVIAYGDQDKIEAHKHHFFAVIAKPIEQQKIVSQITHLMTQA